MKALCVFCGSSLGQAAHFAATARAFGATLAARGIGLVYGGSTRGTMGELAEGALQNGGQVIGVIPRGLEAREIAHRGLTELHVVGSMHQRKAKMAELSDGFVALPGGAGTLEELFEVWTWAMLGLHRKPCAILDVQGFYEPLIEFLNRVEQEGFLAPESRSMLFVDTDANRLLERLLVYRHPLGQPLIADKPRA